MPGCSVLSIPKFAQKPRRMLANCGIGTLAHQRVDGRNKCARQQTRRITLAICRRGKDALREMGFLDRSLLTGTERGPRVVQYGFHDLDRLRIEVRALFHFLSPTTVGLSGITETG